MTKITITTEYAGSYSPSEDRFWEEIEMELENAELLLTRTHVETHEEAIAGTFRNSRGDDDVGGMEVLRRRKVGARFDQLDHYLERGRILLPSAWALARSRQMTFEFVRIWTDLQVCHGFLIAHYMDNSDDLTAHRGGEKNRKRLAAQKKWLCHYLAPRIGKRGTLKEAFSSAISEIHHRIESPGKPPFDSQWYRDMLDVNGDEFIASLSMKHLRKRVIVALAREPDDDIPPR